jgi:hypothetical protein
MRMVAVFLGLAVLLVLSGCGAGVGMQSTIVTPAVKPAVTGVVHGGQNPVSGATIQLWTVGTTGTGSTGTPLVTVTVTTSDGTGLPNSNANIGNANNTLAAGSFTLNFTNAYTCPTPTTLVYLTATGGNPGLTAGTNNSAISLLTALGQCGSLSTSTFVVLNEVTTVASVFTLQEFIGSGGSIGSPSDSASIQAIGNAFTTVGTLVDTATGTALTTDSGGNTVPQTLIDTFADILTACVNSSGPTSSACVTLFSDATPSGGSAPTNVLGATLDVALNPGADVPALFTIAAANAAFQPVLSSAPSSWSVVVSGGASTGCGYSGAGYTVSGTVSYGGTRMGQIYLVMVNNAGCAIGSQGTSIPAAGTYTIRGVPPGTYTLYAFLDTLGYGALNAADPVGNTTVTVSSANVTTANVTIANPSTPTVTSAPTIISVGGLNTGAALQINPVLNGSGAETPALYTVQWSTTSSFTIVAGSKTFPPNSRGTNFTNWFMHGLGLTNGSVYYFRAYGSSAGTSVGPYSNVYGPVTIGAASTGSTVMGSVGFTGTPSGPMYAEVVNLDSQPAPLYGEYIASPSSLQAYSVTVPNSTSAVYVEDAFIDQDNNGIEDAGDIGGSLVAALIGSGITQTSVTGPLANQNLTLPSNNAFAAVLTQHYQTGTPSYSFLFMVDFGEKMPVAVTLLPSANPDGANVAGPMDIAVCEYAYFGCSSSAFSIGFTLGATSPTVGDTYSFDVTYSDGTTGTLIATVTGVLNTFATSLAPQTGTSTTPTFTWADPVCTPCSNYTYQFNLYSPGGQIWGVPNYGLGLAPGTASVVWAVDPTDSGNDGVSALTPGTTYTYQVVVQDNYLNSATATANYTP